MEFVTEKQVVVTSTWYKHELQASKDVHLVNILDLTQVENNTKIELIQEKRNEAKVEEFQHFLPMHCMVPPTTTVPLSQRKKVTMCENTFSKQIVNQRLVAKGLLQINIWGEPTRKIGEKTLHTLGTYLLC